MTYAGNQLIRVDEGVSSAGMAGSEDFKNFTNQTTEYTYNKNGALTKDLNKGITEIRYNSVLLPREPKVNILILSIMYIVASSTLWVKPETSMFMLLRV